MNSPPINVLFVCLGNICRSPTAQGCLTEAVRLAGLGDRIVVESAGTHTWRAGGPPDDRAQAVARAHGVDISQLRARRVSADDLRRSDYVIAMDRDNLADLAAICPAGLEGRLHLLLDFARDAPVRDVPDPYGGGPAGFERTFDLIAAGTAGLLDHLAARVQR